VREMRYRTMPCESEVAGVQDQQSAISTMADGTTQVTPTSRSTTWSRWCVLRGTTARCWRGRCGACCWQRLPAAARRDPGGNAKERGGDGQFPHLQCLHEPPGRARLQEATTLPRCAPHRRLPALQAGRRRTNLVFESHPELTDVRGEGPVTMKHQGDRSFAGGQLLTEIIPRDELRREDVYIANVVKCRPPEIAIRSQTRSRAASVPARQIALVQPR